MVAYYTITYTVYEATLVPTNVTLMLNELPVIQWFCCIDPCYSAVRSIGFASLWIFGLNCAFAKLQKRRFLCNAALDKADMPGPPASLSFPSLIIPSFLCLPQEGRAVYWRQQAQSSA